MNQEINTLLKQKRKETFLPCIQAGDTISFPLAKLAPNNPAFIIPLTLMAHQGHLFNPLRNPK
jgi:hypothetical protein